MNSSVRGKEIKVQREAQSLEHFKSKVAGAEDAHVGLLKPVLTGAGVLVLALLAWAGFSGMRSRAVERHEVALTALLRTVDGGGTTPSTPAEVEKRMREQLPALEELARNAPGSERAVAQGLVANWKLMLGQGPGAAPAAEPKDPWDRLRQAQRSLALGRADEAARLLAPLRSGATPQESWGRAYWTAALDLARLQGNREQALKDLAEFKARYKNLPDETSLDGLLRSI